VLVPVLDERGEVEVLIFCLHDVTANQRVAGRMRRAITAMGTLSRRLTRAREAERRRLALELHDDLGQELTALRLALEILPRPEAADDAARQEEAIAIAGRLQSRVRTISADLRPPMLDDMGLIVALPWLFEKQRASTGLQVIFRQSGLESRLPGEIEIALYRIVQEALTNVVRHAGVSAAQVLLRATDSIIVLKVEDEGRGFDAESEAATAAGTGLLGMRERARLLGGRIVVESVPGAGTALTVELPLSTPRATPGSQP
jgi:signal transduction histidine kinase